METNNTEEQVIEDPKAVLSALERAKGDAKKFREEKEELAKQLQDKDELVSKYTGNLLKEKVSKKIIEAGIKDPERVLKFMNMEQLSLDNDLNVIGIEDQLDMLKNDLPEIFDAKLRVGGQADTAVQTSVSTQFSASQIQAMKILGRI